MGGSTQKCNVCSDCVRICSREELDEYQREHNKKCSGRFESLWKDYDKMTNEEKERKLRQVMFRHGKIGKVE